MSMLLIGVLVTVVGIAVAVAGLIGVRRSVELSLLQDHHDVAGFFIGIIGVLHAVLLAFVVIVVWEDFNDASRTVDNEANELSDIYWLANGLDEANRDRVQEAVRAYAASVVDDEWPAMEDGEHRRATDQALNELRSIFTTMDVPAEDAAIYQESLDRLSALSDSRNERLHVATTGLHTVLWVVLGVGGALTIVFTYFFGVRYLPAQIMMTAGLAMMIVLILFVVWTINHPFQGQFKVDPDSFEDALVEMTSGI